MTLGGGRDGHVSDCEEEFVAAANNEIGQLCAHNVLLWRKLLDAFAGNWPEAAEKSINKSMVFIFKFIKHL